MIDFEDDYTTDYKGRDIKALYKFDDRITKMEDTMNEMKKLLALTWILILLGAVACVQVDPKTGKTIPRGGQRYEFDTEVRRAEKLENGMTKSGVILLLGSPAEVSDDKDVWVYLPERPAVLIPGRALRLVFENGKLIEHGYRAIILGKDL